VGTKFICTAGARRSATAGPVDGGVFDGSKGFIPGEKDTGRRTALDAEKRGSLSREKEPEKRSRPTSKSVVQNVFSFPRCKFAPHDGVSREINDLVKEAHESQNDEASDGQRFANSAKEVFFRVAAPNEVKGPKVSRHEADCSIDTAGKPFC